MLLEIISSVIFRFPWTLLKKLGGQREVLISIEEI